MRTSDAQPPLRLVPRSDAHADAETPASRQTPPVSVEVMSRSTISRQGVRAVLARFPDRVAVLHSSETGPPDVVVFEMSHRSTSDQVALGYLAHQGARVVALVFEGRPDLAARSLVLGAWSCAATTVLPDELVAHVEAAAAGGRSPRSVFVSVPRAAPATPARPRPAQGATAPPGSGPSAPSRGTDDGLDDGIDGVDNGTDELSSREREVLALITAGLSNKQIATSMFLSLNTIKTYVRTAYRKMNVDSRTRAVVWALDHGFDPRPAGPGAGADG